MHFILHALKHSAILLPWLLLSYILIEVIEYFSARKMQHSKLLSGKWATLFGAGFGLVPQCGFSVVATDLFASRKIKIGTLLAVYIATSDEAIPLLIVNPDKALSLIPLLLIKFFVAILVGYFVDLIFKKANEKHLSLEDYHKKTDKKQNETSQELKSNEEQFTQTQENSEEHNHEHNETEPHHNHEEEHNHDNQETDEHNQPHHTGCCGHDIEDDSKKTKAKRFLLHPFIHTLKIFAFILIINIIFEGLVELVGEDSIKNFLLSSKAFAPLLSAVVGLIPNCASSVLITELYTIGGIGFGAYVAGLIVNAGIGFVVLFKQNKNIKQNFALLGAMLAIGITIGYIIQLIGF